MAITKQAREKAFKEEFMQKLIEALKDFEPSRITDYGTLAIPVQIDGEDRYITLKAVLTKAYDEEKETGFDIFTAEGDYAYRVNEDAKKAEEKEAKSKANLEKKAKREADLKAKKEKEAAAKAVTE